MCTGTKEYKVAMLVDRLTKAIHDSYGRDPSYALTYEDAETIVRDDEVTTTIWQRHLQNILCLIGQRVHVSERMLANWLVDGVFKGMLNNEAIETMNLMTTLFEFYGIRQTKRGRVVSTHPEQ